MDDDQTCPEHVLLVAMERAFRGPAYANAQTRDWQPHMKRILQCVRENDPMIKELRSVIASLNHQISNAIASIHKLHDAPDFMSEALNSGDGTYRP